VPGGVRQEKRHCRLAEQAGTRDWAASALEEPTVEGCTRHCNRHTFASRLVMAGVDLRTVAELLGHKTL
jgi:site-specific recombinase XerD